MSRVLVIGDLMLDIYVKGNVDRISPEAPVPIFSVGNNEKEYIPGGAANVALNIKAAGNDVDLFGMIGTDQEGKRLTTILKKKRIGVENVICGIKPTTQKIRYLGQNNQQVIRVDIENIEECLEETYREKLESIVRNISDYSVVVFSDYCKGFLTERICRRVIDASKVKNIPILVDLKDVRFRKYLGATIIKPNKRELKELTKMSVDTMEEVSHAAITLCQKAKCDYVLTTLGADGMMLVNVEKQIQYEKTVAKEVFDVTGAGDTTIAYLASEIANGLSINEAIKIANVAAGIQVTKLGTNTVYRNEVEQVYRIGDNKRDKIPKRNSLIEEICDRKHKGERIVFTNGCFDILHYGHVKYLQEAKKMGDILVVGVNSDDSVRRLKGKNRPVNKLDDRIKVLEALECVDYVLQFCEDTPIELIRTILPDVLVKGSDYKKEEIVGYNEVVKNGGRVEVVDYLPDRSTTNIITKIEEI